LKKFDFDKALEELNEEEMDDAKTAKAKLLMTILPFVIIILILGGMLLSGTLKNESGKDKEQADISAGSEIIQTDTEPEDSDSDMGSDVVKAEDTPTPSAEQKESASPSKSPEEADEDNTTATTTPEKTPDNMNEEPGKEESVISGKVPSYVNEPFRAEPQLAELYDYFVSDNKKAIEDLVHLDRYKAMSYSLNGTNDFYYFGDKNAEGKPHGKGISVYADNRYYYGDWLDGKRSGGGFFIHYHMPECYTNKNLIITHQYTGSWKNDVPDGEGSEHFDYYTDRFKKNIGYNTNLLGNYQNGLIHGDFYITNRYSDDNIKEWDAVAEKGSWVYRSNSTDDVGRGPVFVDREDKDNYIWMHPDENQNIGVSCLIVP